MSPSLFNKGFKLFRFAAPPTHGNGQQWASRCVSKVMGELCIPTVIDHTLLDNMTSMGEFSPIPCIWLSPPKSQHGSGLNQHKPYLCFVSDEFLVRCSSAQRNLRRTLGCKI